jgi:hypothetical protein
MNNMVTDALFAGWNTESRRHRSRHDDRLIISWNILHSQPSTEQVAGVNQSEYPTRASSSDGMEKVWNNIQATQ